MSSPSFSGATERPDAGSTKPRDGHDHSQLKLGVEATASGASKADKVDTHLNGSAEATSSNSLNGAVVQASALLQSVEEGKSGLFAVFGGQGPSWLDELRALYTSSDLARSVIEEAAAIVLEQSEKSEISVLYHPFGFGLISWLHSVDVPSPEYLSSAPVSCAMILLTQMVTYMTTCAAWGKTPLEAKKLFHGATGHSQGLLGATLFSMASTQEELAKLTLDAVRFMVWFGVRLQQATPFSLDVREEVRMEAKQLGYGQLSPMMAVLHLEAPLVNKYMAIVNKSVANHPSRQIQIGLKNSATIHIVVGHPESLLQLAALLHRAELPAKNNVDQNRVPFSKRKRRFAARFLNVSVPFHHSGLLAGAIDSILADAKNLGFDLDATKMTLPVYGSCGTPAEPEHPATSLPKQLNAAGADLLRTLIHLQGIAVVDWVHTMRPIAVDRGLTHLIDFGHGGTGGIGGLCARLLIGAGIQTISAGATAPEYVNPPTEGSGNGSSGNALQLGPILVQDRSGLFSSDPAAVVRATNWAAEYAPRVVMTNGKPVLETKYTRALGKPPVMVGGMTPTTVNHGLVAAVLNAGYHGELAGGGLPTEKMFRAKIKSLVAAAQPGAGVTVNLLFLNPSQWGMQFPLVVKLAKEGVPLEGITIGAGVPSLDKATEIIASLRSAGLRHIGFKPGSADTIRQVIAIAQASPEMTVLLQWTGGRGGGHHSYEDFHEPIAATYAEIRRVPNLVLVGGSGFGDAQDSWPYMDGTWSIKFGHPPMPFDAILVASRVMVALEAGTSTAVKELIVATPGVEAESQWESSYDGNAGGVVNVTSELGESIHNVATRGVMLWRQFDKEIFSLPKDKMTAKIEERKRWIIERLNADFQKVYFGKKFDGTVCDLEAMTYAEVAFRMVELQYIKDTSNGSGRWIHPDYLHLVKDFISRIEERFIGKTMEQMRNEGADESTEEKKVRVSQLGPLEGLETNPQAYLAEMTHLYPDAMEQLLSSEDVDFFISLCRQRGRKPVNFVPLIDKELSYWFKKDSLWQSEDIDAVEDRDVQRVVILQGPVAVRYSKRVNEPVAEILNGIHDGWVKTLLEKTGTDVKSLPAVENLVVAGTPFSGTIHSSISGAESVVSVTRGSKSVDLKSLTLRMPQDAALLPTNQEMLASLAACSNSSWWRSVLNAPFITQSRLRQENIISALFRPRPGQAVQLVFEQEIGGDLAQVRIFEPHVLPTFPSHEPFVVLSFDAATSVITLRLHHKRPVGGSNLIPLDLLFKFVPTLGHACIHELTEGKNDRVKKMYAQLWFNELSLADASPLEAVFENKFALTRENIVHFCQSIGRPISMTADSGTEKVVAPVDIAIVAGWESIIKSLFLNAIDADILKLVHLSNSFKRLSQTQLVEGDEVITQVRITEIANTPTGQRVSVKGTLSLVSNPSEPVIGVQSAFFIRGVNPLPNPFRRVSEERIVVLSKKETLAILMSKSWAKWHSGKPALAVGDRLVFRLESCEMALADGLFNTHTSGTIIKQALHAKLSTVVDGEEIGTFDVKNENVAGCVVRSFLHRFGTNMEHPYFFNNSGYNMIVPDKLKVPLDNNVYAVASGDLNPIHTNPYFAILTKLPTTITHGMWTSANARRVVEVFVAKRGERVVDFHTEFVGMVQPGDVLVTRVKHVGMKNGRLLVEIRTECEKTGEIVLKGTADITGAKTSYVFTGQGSAEVNMGMDLYSTSAISKSLWDAADLYFANKYGFSILSIVKTNPKEIEIFFGGKKGESMRRNYQQLTQQVQVRDDVTGKLVTKQLPLFPQITDTSSSFIFRHPDGLLFATQFSQPALVLVELAAFSDLREKGLIPSDCIFAGHSLGEYAALASVASVLSTESLVDIVFLRGMTMQNAVIRDAAGRSPYAMVAVNTGRVHPTHFREAQLNQVIEAITKARPELLQVVNYNVDNYQYVVAGERGNLNALGFVLNALFKKLQGGGAQALAALASGGSGGKGGSLADTPEMQALLEQAIAQALDSRDPVTGLIPLERGMATIPLPGIDVPFHSHFLKGGVPPFRQILQQRMNVQALNKDLLIGRYIPNVTAAPFSLDKSYIASVQENTQSSILSEVLENFEAESKQPQTLAFKLLIELLAYQFASPVRWIETQHLFFSKLNVERFIEIGPAPTLFAMAKRTIETGSFSPLVSREILWYGRDKANIYYQGTDVEAEEPTESAPAPSRAPAAAPVAAPAPVVHVAPVAPVATHAAAASVPDAPASGLEFIQALVSIRLKKPVASVAATDTIKAIVSGKSALQNELLGDLETEFGTKMPEGASDASLESLAKQMSSGYKQLGKVGTTLTHKLVSNKMPGGFGMSQVKNYLNKTFGLGDGRVQSVLLHAATIEPAARLGSEAEAHAFLDGCVTAYGSRIGQTFAAASAASVAAPAYAPGPAAVSAPASIPDEPLRAIDALRVMVSLKVKKSLDLVPATSTIKELVGGKSALQNELVGDIQKEFGTEPGDGAAELDLTGLAGRMGGSYNKPGPYLSAAINKLVSTKMPGGYGLSSVKSYLSGRFGLGDGRIDGVLVHALALEPNARFGAEGEAQAYLDQVAQDYASKHGISLSSGSSASSSRAAGPAVDSAALKAFEARYHVLVKDLMRVYHDYLGEDPLAANKLKQMQEDLTKQAESQLSVWQAEHGVGDDYFEGIKPVFDVKKERRYNSSWNWNRQDCLQLYYDYACGRATQWTIDIRERLYHIKNRATPSVVELVEHYLQKSTDDGHGEIKAFIQLLADTLRFVMDEPPKYREHRPPTQPTVSIGSSGHIQYREAPRTGVKDMEAYVHEMHRGPQTGQIRAVLEETKAHGSKSSHELPAGTPAEHVEEMRVALKQLTDALDFLQKQKAPDAVVQGLVGQITKLKEAITRASASTPAASTAVALTSPRGAPSLPPTLLPYLFLRQASKHDPSHRAYHEDLTNSYLTSLMKMASEGVSLSDKVALVIGCGKGSIGVEVVKALLQAGAKVYATTSRFSADSSSFYHKLFDRNGSKHSELVVLPFNQGSVQDVQALVKYIYDVEKSDLDYIIPFAALPENGRDIGDIDGRSELAHRIMLTNVLRLIGAIKEKKKSLAIVTRPAHVLLPMSPNHGIFGFDGLYAESKLGLEALLNKWHSEGWRQYLSLAGAIIGWTRGTGLMNQNNVVAAGIEKMGARTFNASEMAFNLMGLLHPDMVVLAQNEPVLADLNGCLHLVPHLNVAVSDLRASLIEEASLQKSIAVDHALDEEVMTGKRSHPISSAPTSVTRRANITVPFPAIPNPATLDSVYSQAKGMVDLENVVVITGFGEVGPYGSSRTRWEMESYGEFSVEGCIELAWMMGLIKYQADGSGWQDMKTGERVRDDQIKTKYEPVLLAHTGIRLIEPELFGGYDPHNKMFLHQVALNSDMAPLEVSAEEARAFKQRHGEAVDTYQDESNPDAWYVKLNKGAVLYIPKALKFDRFVAGQVPSTWNPSILGIPQDIINQVDRVTLFSLFSTVEALVSAGMTDPYEFYQYIHVSELGNTFGGGFGGMEAIRRTYRNRLLELPVQGDILQETFINTVGAWLNMLLLSSSGPIKTPVGACATAVESVEIGVDTIKSGKAKVVIVGGYDDFGEEGSYEFANMKATASSADEIAKGRTPREMSRPATSTRAGFVESQGAGSQILMTAALAVQMGVPIYGIVEHVSTATDKVGRSVPAPGQGILTTARENHTRNPGFVSPLLNIEYRRKQLEMELKMVNKWSRSELAQLEASETPAAKLENSETMSTGVVPQAGHDQLLSPRSDSSVVTNQSTANSEAHKEAMRAHILHETSRRKRIAYSTWGNDFYRGNPAIAPLRGALAVYGLNVDDIAVASFHGTGTKGNDLNESQVVQKQLEHLGRSKGNVILTIFQKYLTGHPKGAAAAWMLNGMLQSMLSGIVPGNRNADNIDPKLRDLSQVVYLNRSLHTYGFKAGLLKSFGFGQVGGEVLLIHPNFVLGQLSELELRQYVEKRAARQNAAYRHWQNSITGKSTFVAVKDHPPYASEDESRVYLDPLARASYDEKQKSWSFPAVRGARRASSMVNPGSSGNAQGGSGSRDGSKSEAKGGVVGQNGSGVASSAGALSPSTWSTRGPMSSGMAKSQSVAPGTSRTGSNRRQSQSGAVASSSAYASERTGPGTGSSPMRRDVPATALNHMEVMMREMGEGLRTTIDRGIGVDAQSIDEIDVCVTNTDFVARNFTVAEISYCRASPDPSSSFAGRWAAKEAVIKAISSCDSDNLTARNLWQGGGAPLKDIEILPSSSGAPIVQLSGHAADVAGLLSITTIKVSISHSGDYAIAQAIAR